jgi:hypothetical protein
MPGEKSIEKHMKFVVVVDNDDGDDDELSVFLNRMSAKGYSL